MSRVALAVTVFFVSVAVILLSGYGPAQVAAGVVVLASGRAVYLLIRQQGEADGVDRAAAIIRDRNESA